MDLERARIFIRPGYTDLRKGVGGLTVLVQEQMGEDPLSGRVYLFCNKWRKLLKAVWRDRLEPLKIGKVYTDGNYAYYERFSSEVLRVTKKNRQKIERKHLSLRTWRARLVRKGIRFSKTEQTRKIVVGLIINV